MRVDKATAADIPGIVAMEQEPDTKAFIIPYARETHAKHLSDPNIVYLAIRDGAKLIGFFILAFEPDGKSVEFRRIVVSPKGRGVGQKAIGQMEQFCRGDLGRSRIWLDVFEYNERGRHVYEKLGYEKFGSAVHEGDVLLLYEKQL